MDENVCVCQCISIQNETQCLLETLSLQIVVCTARIHSVCQHRGWDPSCVCQYKSIQNEIQRSLDSLSLQTVVYIARIHSVCHHRGQDPPQAYQCIAYQKEVQHLLDALSIQTRFIGYYEPTNCCLYSKNTQYLPPSFSGHLFLSLERWPVQTPILVLYENV